MSTTTTAKPPAMTPAAGATETLAVGNRLSELCAQGKFAEAMNELYADNARHVEVAEMPGSPFKRIIEGKKALLDKAAYFARTTTVHGATCGKPLVNGDQFVCAMSLDCTCKEGPMAGQRMNMTEQALYTVANGKITEAKFFYGMCGG